MRNLLLLVLTLTSLKVLAHPVSYKDAIGIMSYNNSKMNEILLTYSLSSKFAVADRSGSIRDYYGGTDGDLSDHVAATIRTLLEEK